MYNFVCEVWDEELDLSSHNSTFLTLIPKMRRPKFMNQFCPITLCNVSYKMITKVVMNRLKPFMNDLVFSLQSSFISNRSIHDNTIITYEMFHSMRRMKGNKGFFAIKVDLEKAYNILSWEFIDKVLSEVNISSTLKSLIMRCISMNILI